MNLTPKARANIVGFVVMAPFLVSIHVYRDSLSQRGWMYVALVSSLASMLAYQWVYHRQAAMLPASALPRPELHLAPDRMPDVVWLALVPPALLMVLLWWVTLHGSELPWRDTWLGPPKPATEHRMYLHTVVAVIFFNCLASWQVVYSLARWHGMARAYPYRRERLQWAVGNQWLMLAFTVAWFSGNNFRMPAVLATTCGIVVGIGGSTMIWMGWRLHALRTADPQTGTWCYFDFRDPTFFGPRGLNLANGWSWALAAAGIAPILLAEWLLHGAQG